VFGVAVYGTGLYVADLTNHRALYFPAGASTATRVSGQLGDFTTATANNGGVSTDSLKYIRAASSPMQVECTLPTRVTIVCSTIPRHQHDCDARVR
jgi:hypothetical protein